MTEGSFMRGVIVGALLVTPFWVGLLIWWLA
jgi:hypothetical protein